MTQTTADIRVKMDRMERRLSLVEGVMSSLKDEAGGLAATVAALIKAEGARTEALDDQHQSYAAARQRAELFEARAVKFEAELHRIEDKLAALEARSEIK